MVRIGWAAKVAVGGLAIVAAALVAFARFGTTEPPGPTTLKTVAPGVYTSPPPGIVPVNGECKGKLPLPPAASYYRVATTVPYPVIFDCAARTFTVLKSLPNPVFAGDLTLTNEGYYLHESRFTDRGETCSYLFYDRGGSEIREVTQAAGLTVHDQIERGRPLTLIHK